ncbi:winged helix-turn-helix transcriptional regulator [Pandoraea fibrosis]|uniref:Winged helix-turn-helix transcriptional regulator n=1 Tax=Pandoraea fibrosis TaxID=1891094 RepID=A0ABX6HUQ5_9BURK|nr:Lrp/AsnC family transcriptional regulator [Pandoraea fibrosis]QHE91813.1 winged helix-turn-helix transcriptional regulator [Pandoraea fibrosis]QHF14629.1 winged helix-turn-helix transcriptional regulator [Pandoraea fibrosis]
MAGVTLDDLDLRILSVLQADSSLSNLELSRRVHASAPTCLRRVRALVDAGVIARQIAIIDPSKLGPTLSAVVEVSLDRQAAEDYDAFESYICAEPVVTQCYRVSPGPDFVVIAEVRDMAEYDELARRLFKSSANIRNVRTFFSTRCAKFEANARILPIRSNASR